MNLVKSSGIVSSKSGQGKVYCARVDVHPFNIHEFLGRAVEISFVLLFIWCFCINLVKER